MTDVLTQLEQTIAARRSAGGSDSYVAKLNARGLEVMAQKLGEEATEAVIAAVTQNRSELIAESADVMFHLLVLLDASGVTLADVMAELERREGTSGLAEKAARTKE
jgi:phosphoribosyl-ATP pyrophosphohydrolase